MTASARTSAAAPRSLGELLGSAYKRWTLDCIVVIAHAVAKDFSSRPNQWQHVPADAATQLTDLKANYGFQAAFPDDKTRRWLMSPIFGESDGSSSADDQSEFKTSRQGALAAATAFSENAQAPGFPMLRRRVRDAVKELQTHLHGLGDQQDAGPQFPPGASLLQTDRRMTLIFDASQSLLTTPEVSGVFHITGIAKGWPLTSDDPRGANLIQEITRQLPNLPYISRDWFVNMQRIGEEGSRSIRTIADEDTDHLSDQDIDQLITDLYAWHGELKSGWAHRPQQMMESAAGTGQSPEGAAGTAQSPQADWRGQVVHGR